MCPCNMTIWASFNIVKQNHQRPKKYCPLIFALCFSVVERQPWLIFFPQVWGLVIKSESLCVQQKEGSALCLLLLLHLPKILTEMLGLIPQLPR